MSKVVRFKKFLYNERYFLSIIIFIFLLQLLTYPSIHHIIDEQIFLDIGKNICNLNFSDFFGPRGGEDYTHNTFLYQTVLCITSPLHNFEVERAEIVTYLFFIFLLIGWYYSIPNEWKVNKKLFILLLFSNSLLWVYSFRVLIDVPLAFFLSLGMLNLFIFFQYRRSKNYYIAFILLSLSLLTKETAILFIPIFFLFLLFKKVKNVKDYVFVLLPILPWFIFTVFQYSSGFPVLKEYINVGLKGESYPSTPYIHLPTIAFIIGIFGFGVISLVWMWKNSLKKRSIIKDFLIFSLILYLVWEIVFDFIIFANAPKYDTPLIPFLSLIITMGYKENKILRYIFYLTLIYTLATGFLAGYYFHTEESAIWISIKNIIK